MLALTIQFTLGLQAWEANHLLSPWAQGNLEGSGDSASGQSLAHLGLPLPSAPRHACAHASELLLVQEGNPGAGGSYNSKGL